MGNLVPSFTRSSHDSKFAHKFHQLAASVHRLNTIFKFDREQTRGIQNRAAVSKGPMWKLASRSMHRYYTKHSLRSMFEMLPSQYRSPLLGGIGLMSVASVTTAAAVPHVVPFEWQNTKHL